MRRRALFVKAALCRRRGGIDQPNAPMARSLCEASLAPASSSSLFISLTSLAGYMLLIKHAARLLIVNQIQFVPRARREWASPPRTKVSETAMSELNKRPRASLSMGDSRSCFSLAGSPLNEALIPAGFQAGGGEMLRVKPSPTLPHHLLFTHRDISGRNKALHQDCTCYTLCELS